MNGKINKNIAMKVGWIFTVAVWGFVAPNFCFTDDNITVLDEEYKVVEEYESQEIFYELLEGDNHIQVKSRLFELWKEK